MYIDVLDDDGGPNEDLIDIVLADLQPGDLVAGDNFTSPREVFPGSFFIAFMRLSFQLECLPGFVGEDCLDSAQICEANPCDNGGVCELGDAVGEFTCTCVGDFTGEFCDVTINDCLNVNCNNGGTCVDGVGTFTCECEAGYMGQFCEEMLTGIGPAITSPSTNMGMINPDPNTSSSNTGVVAGAVVGGLLLLLLVAGITVAVFVLLAKSKAKSTPKPYGGMQVIMRWYTCTWS